MKAPERTRTCRWILAALTAQVVWMSNGVVWAAAAEGPLSKVGLMRGVGILAAVAGIVGLILVHYVYRERIPRGTYHWLLLVGLFILPLVTSATTTVTVMEGYKSVQACASCHVMDPFVNDLKNPTSSTLAARHYKNNWIAKDQCYACHVSYGVSGGIEGKRDGFRHFVYYVTNTYHDPIKFTGSYNNANCLNCHAGTTIWERVKSHQALTPDLTSNKVACIQCHGPPHPIPSERAAAVKD